MFGLNSTLDVDGGVVSFDLVEKSRCVHVFEFASQLLERVRTDLGHALDAIFVAQQMGHLAIEDLPGELARLFENHAAILGVRVVAEVGALVDEAPAAAVDHDSERIAVLLKAIADAQVAELGRVAIPSHGVASRPVAVGHRADFQRHPDPVAGVEPRAAHFGQVPSGTEVARAPFGVGLEAARGEHHRFAPR